MFFITLIIHNILLYVSFSYDHIVVVWRWQCSFGRLSIFHPRKSNFHAMSHVAAMLNVWNADTVTDVACPNDVDEAVVAPDVCRSSLFLLVCLLWAKVVLYINSPLRTDCFQCSVERCFPKWQGWYWNQYE